MSERDFVDTKNSFDLYAEQVRKLIENKETRLTTIRDAMRKDRTDYSYGVLKGEEKELLNILKELKELKINSLESEFKIINESVLDQIIAIHRKNGMSRINTERLIIEEVSTVIRQKFEPSEIGVQITEKFS